MYRFEDKIRNDNIWIIYKIFIACHSTVLLDQECASYCTLKRMGDCAVTGS